MQDIKLNKLDSRSLWLIVVIIIYWSAYPSYAQNKKYSDEVEKRIRLVETNLMPAIKIDGEANFSLIDRMKFYHANGVSIAVIKDFKIEWARGYGWADSAEQRPVTTNTLFQAGSISKSLNAVGVLKLVQDKKLSLYNDINDYLKTWKFPYDTTSHRKKISVANLLSHTAGLTVHGFPGYAKGDSIPTLKQILDGKRPANTSPIRSAFEPSLKYQYSGGGITISQVIVQDVSASSYTSFMQENVLNPIGMKSSFYNQPPPNDRQLNMATAYYNNGQPVKGKYHIYPEQAAAGLWTNPTDLAAYIIETQLALQGKSSRVLSKEMTSLRLTPYIDSSAALGVFILTRGGEKYFNHGGVDEGFVSQYYGSENGGNGVVVMSNTYNTQILDEIVNSVASVYNWKDFSRVMIKKIVPVSDELLNLYVGRYELAPNFILTVTKEGHRLWTQATGQEKFEVFPETENKFFPKPFEAQLEFIKDANGVVTKLLLHQNGHVGEAKKLD